MNTPYRQLEVSKRQFRLLRLFDCSLEHLECELRTISLCDEHLPPWKALSYRWGEDESGFVVYIENHPIPLRQNLYNIMSQMVTENRRDWIFIDALCIDQSNVAERSAQVQLMGEIYRRAEEVVAWLLHEPGDNEEETDEPDDDEEVTDESDDDEGAEIDRPIHEVNEIQLQSNAQLNSAILENSYWSRLWIIQEVLLAKTLTIRMGSAKVFWESVLPRRNTWSEGTGLPVKNDQLLTGPYANKGPYAKKKTAVNILRYRWHRASSLRAGQHLPFHTTFDFFAQQCCSKLHDRVFGYLSLTNSRIQVDYSMSIIDLFIAGLADYFLSAGFITQDLKRKQFRQTYVPVAQASSFITPLVAFELDLYDPIINLLYSETAKFFVPGYEETFTLCAMATWWCKREDRFSDSELAAFVRDNDAKFELRWIGNFCIKFVKFVASEHRAFTAFYKEFTAKQKVIIQEDAVLSVGGSTMKCSEWAAHAKAISSQMWERFQESGEDIEGDLEDESWTLIA